MVRNWLAQVGIRLETKEIPWAELVTGARMRQCDLFFLGWTGDTGDPDNFLQPLFNSTNHGDLGNRTFFTDAGIDAKLAAGQSIRDPERRRQHYQELQRLLHDLAPWVFLSYEDQFLVTRPEVRGLSLHPLGMVYLENAWLDPTMNRGKDE